MSQRSLGRKELPALQALVGMLPWLCVCACVAGQPWMSTASHGYGPALPQCLEVLPGTSGSDEGSPVVRMLIS